MLDASLSNTQGRPDEVVDVVSADDGRVVEAAAAAAPDGGIEPAREDDAEPMTDAAPPKLGRSDGVDDERVEVRGELNGEANGLEARCACAAAVAIVGGAEVLDEGGKAAADGETPGDDDRDDECAMGDEACMPAYAELDVTMHGRSGRALDDGDVDGRRNGGTAWGSFEPRSRSPRPSMRCSSGVASARAASQLPRRSGSSWSSAAPKSLWKVDMLVYDALEAVEAVEARVATLSSDELWHSPSSDGRVG